MSKRDPRYRVEPDAEGRRWVERRDELLVCDFCLAEGPTWEFPTTPMPVVGHPAMSHSGDDAFLACDECCRLIRQSSIGGLVERMVREQRRNQPAGRYGTLVVAYPPAPIHRRLARENVLRFMDARLGPPHPFTAP